MEVLLGLLVVEQVLSVLASGADSGVERLVPVHGVRNVRSHHWGLVGIGSVGRHLGLLDSGFDDHWSDIGFIVVGRGYDFWSTDHMVLLVGPALASGSPWNKMVVEVYSAHSGVAAVGNSVFDEVSSFSESNSISIDLASESFISVKTLFGMVFHDFKDVSDQSGLIFVDWGNVVWVFEIIPVVIG